MTEAKQDPVVLANEALERINAMLEAAYDRGVKRGYIKGYEDGVAVGLGFTPGKADA